MSASLVGSEMCIRDRFTGPSESLTHPLWSSLDMAQGATGMEGHRSACQWVSVRTTTASEGTYL
eukprot:8244988-Alexandrium_andersonii.AAC.1